MISWSCTRESVREEALKHSAEVLADELANNKHLYWHKEVIAHVLTEKLYPKQPQKQILKFVELNGAGNIDALAQYFHRGSINALVRKGILIEENRSRLREDDREMVYWTEVRLTQPLDKALKEG